MPCALHSKIEPDSRGTSPAMTDEKPVTCAALRVAPYYLSVTGAGSGGAVVGWVPGTLDTWACGSGAAFGPGSGAAEAVVVDAGGEPPGSTTTRVPTFTRSNRSETSSLSIPMQPE